MFSLEVDVQVTRRQRMIFVQDQDRVPRWSGKSLADAFDWLLENDQFEVRVTDGDRCYVLTIDPCPD